jgi:hypothetical protein
LNVGARALITIERMKTPTIAMMNVNAAPTTPATSGTRYVPPKGTVKPMSDPPIRPATAPMAASGAT